MHPAGADVAAWRARILDALLAAVALLALPPVVFTVRAQLLGDRFVPAGLIVSLCWAGVVALAVWRRGSYRLRAAAVLLVFFAVGLYGLQHFGLRSGGRVILIACAALGTVFYGWRAGVLLLLAGVAGSALVGLGHAAGWWTEVVLVVGPGEAWLNATLVMTLAGGAIVMSTGFLTSRLQLNLDQLAEAQGQLRQRARVLEAVSALSQGLLRGTRWADGLVERLAALGEALAVDRVSVVELRDGALHLRGQWNAPGIDPWPVREISVADHHLEPFVDALGRGVVFVSDPSQLPEAPRKLAARIGMASGVSYPILIEGELWGFLGLSDAGARVDWEPFNDILGATAANLGAAIARDRLRAEREERAHELEERVAERTAELEALSHSVSHDLRAPLRHITGYAELLAERAGDALDPESRRFLATIESSAARMNLQMEQLMSFARMGRLAIKREVVELAPMVRELIDELARGRDIDWQVGELPAVRGDRTLVRQVLANLLGNAVKFTARVDAPRIAIGGRTVGGRIEVTITDNGAGFDPRYADKLFGVFQRLHRTEEFEGTGIGLALAKRIVARHGGTMTAEGEPDRGATFRFTLPRA